MEFVILDLEWNGAYNRRTKGFLNEIIEFGAVKVDENLELLDTFEVLIHPAITKKLSGKIRTLTNITNEDLAAGYPFMEAVGYFQEWVGDAALLTWGTSDILVLIENFRYFTQEEQIPFLSQYADLQAYCEQAIRYEKGKQMGLSTAAKLLKIDVTDFDHHRALEDSLLSLRCMQLLYKMEDFLPFLLKADEEFYRRIQFKTTIVCDLEHPLIKRSDMVFHCDRCGRRAVRQSEWQLKNKSYRAVFLCRSCQYKFYGRVQFKLKYEGMLVKKRILPYKEKTEEPEGEPSAAEPISVSVKLASEAKSARDEQSLRH